MNGPSGTGNAVTETAVIKRGDVRLATLFMLPAGQPPYPCVVFVHGLGSGKDSPRNLVLAARLVDEGMAALLFDLSGHGESDPDPRPGDEPYVDDLAAVLRWAARRPEVDAGRIAVAGSSLGAAVAVAAVRKGLVGPAALVLRAPPVSRGDLDGINIPTLVLVGGCDPLAGQVLAAAGGLPGVTLSVIEGAGHLFEEPGTLEQMVETTAAWLRGQLLEREQAAGSRAATGGKGGL